MFHFSAAVGPVFFRTCMDEDRCSSQTTKDSSESLLPVATLQSLFVPQTEC